MFCSASGNNGDAITSLDIRYLSYRNLIDGQTVSGCQTIERGHVQRSSDPARSANLAGGLRLRGGIRDPCVTRSGHIDTGASEDRFRVTAEIFPCKALDMQHEVELGKTHRRKTNHWAGNGTRRSSPSLTRQTRAVVACAMEAPGQSLDRSKSRQTGKLQQGCDTAHGSPDLHGLMRCLVAVDQAWWTDRGCAGTWLFDIFGVYA